MVLDEFDHIKKYELLEYDPDDAFSRLYKVLKIAPTNTDIGKTLEKVEHEIKNFETQRNTPQNKF
jgi:hypothetical protein